MCFEQFHYSMKLGAERAKLEQLIPKFVPRRRVGIFRNERTRSTPLDPKLTFWCILYYLGAWPFGLLTKLGAQRAELVQKFVPRSRVVIFHNEPTRSTPFDSKLIFLCILYCLGALWTVFFLLKLVSKRAELEQLMQNFESRSCVGIFSQRMHPIHPLVP